MANALWTALAKMKTPADRQEFIAGVLAGNSSVAELAIYFCSAARRSEDATLKELKPFLQHAERARFKENLSAGFQVKRAEKRAALTPVRTDAEMNGDLKTYVSAADDYARRPSKASKQRLDEAKARLEDGLAAWAAELDALEPETKTYQRAQARYGRVRCSRPSTPRWCKAWTRVSCCD